jgi:hypothetical protein
MDRNLPVESGSHDEEASGLLCADIGQRDADSHSNITRTGHGDESRPPGHRQPALGVCGGSWVPPRGRNGVLRFPPRSRLLRANAACERGAQNESCGAGRPAPSLVPLGLGDAVGFLAGVLAPAAADPEIPNSRSPDSRFGRESGREFPVPDSAGNGNREIPRFPIRPGNGNRGPDWPQLGKSGIPCARGEYIWHDPGLDVALSPSNADSGLPPPSFFNCQGPADGG